MHAGRGGLPDAVSALVSVELRTRYLPPVSWALDEQRAPSSAGGGFGAWLLAQLRPAVSVSTPFGSFKKAPYGEPGAWSPALLIALGATVLGVLALAVVGARSLLRRRRVP